METIEKRYNLSNLQAKFTDYLIAENISSITLKNYRSDIKHFFNWAAKGNSNSDISHITSFETILEYKNYQVKDLAPLKTVNRRLSAIRKFCAFCISQGWITENPAKKVINVTSKIENNSQSCHSRLDRESRNKTILNANTMDLRMREDDKKVHGDDNQHQDDNQVDLLAEFKSEFPSDFDNLHDYFQIINYPQLQGK
jgi:site-specific recombinase XerC